MYMVQILFKLKKQSTCNPNCPNYVFFVFSFSGKECDFIYCFSLSLYGFNSTFTYLYTCLSVGFSVFRRSQN